ncbi:Crp/Fnr family transcriptional regulator [Niabella terrae]
MRRLVPLTEEETAYFISLMEYRSLKKFDKLVRYGEVCQHVCYISKGLIRYAHESDGKEYTHRFFKENEWVGNYVSFLDRTPSAYFLEALEDTDLLQVSYEKVQKAYDKFKVFERFGRRMAETLFTDLVQRTTDAARKSPELRYIELEHRDPELLARVPLKYIASMLGIEPGSLSRIRKRIQK